MKRKLHHADRIRLQIHTWAAMLVVWVWIMVPPTPAAVGKRVAFVVGIGTYDNLLADKQLKNPVNDAEGVSARLTEIGFQVVTAPNLTRSAFNDKWQNVLDGLSKEDTFVLFYSGHGVQIDGKNYLLPRDIPYLDYRRGEQLKRESISLDELLADLSTGDRPHPQNSIVILDACRDNPLIPPGYKSVSTARGLADPPQPDGIFVLYAAASNRTALDRLSSSDPAKYSVFTRTLLPLIERSDLSIQELSYELKDKVWDLAKSAGQEQRPTYYDGIIGRFCLPGCVEKPAAVRLRDEAISQHLSSEARNHLDKQLDLALLLSVEAYKRARTTEALQSLFTTLDSAGSTIFLHGHPGDGRHLAFSKDNRILVSGSDKGTLRLWDLSQTPPDSMVLTGHQGEIVSLALSPTNNALASSDESGKVLLWDLSKKPPRSRGLHGHKSRVSTLTFNPEGKVLASGDGYGNVFLWTVESSSDEYVALQGQPGYPAEITFGSDGESLISGSTMQEGAFLRWDLSVMPPRQSHPFVVPEGSIQAYAASPDGKWFSLSDSKGHLWLWDVTMDLPQPTSLPGYQGPVTTLAFGPDGKKLVAGDRLGTLLVWDLMMQPPRSIPLSTPAQNVFTHGVWRVAFSPNGTTVAASSGNGVLILWELKANSLRPTFLGGHRDVVEMLRFSPDGKHLITSDNHGTFLIWHLHDQSPRSSTIPGHRDGLTNFAFTADGQSVAVVDSIGTFMIWRIDGSGNIQTHLHGEKQGGIEQVHFSDDGMKLAVEQSGSLPSVWDITVNPPHPFSTPKPPGGVGTLRLSPDGTRLVVGGRDNITLWNLTSLPQTSISLPSHGHNEYIWRLRFSSDSKFLASSDGRDVLLWNLKDPSFPKPFRADHFGRTGNFAFSPDNKYLASGGANGTLLLWDLSTTPPQLSSLQGHPSDKDNSVVTIVFSPDGQSLVSGDSKTNLFLWDIRRREPRAIPLPASNRARLVAFSPKSDKLVIDGDTNSLLVFNLTSDLGSPIPLSGHKDLVTDIAFSPNGSLISTDIYGTVLTWDVRTSPPHLAQLWTYQGPMRKISSGHEQFIFSPMGDRLAVSVGDLLLLGDLTVTPPRSIQLSSNQNFVKPFAFSPDGKTLAGSVGNKVVLWNVDFDSWVKQACLIANRNLTSAEWAHFLPNDPNNSLTCKNLQPRL